MEGSCGNSGGTTSLTSIGFVGSLVEGTNMPVGASNSNQRRRKRN
jgi:hypothetical protein